MLQNTFIDDNIITYVNKKFKTYTKNTLKKFKTWEHFPKSFLWKAIAPIFA